MLMQPSDPQMVVEDVSEDECEGSLLLLSNTTAAAAAAAMGADGSTATDFRRECDHVSLGDLCYGVCFASNLPNLVLMILYYYYPPLSSSNQ